MSEVENMVDAIEKLVDKKIANAMRGGSSTVPATYMGTDSEGKAWVVLAGADAATPVRRTSVEAARGDTVSVTVADGMAVIDANLTDKSAGVASVAKADEKAVVAQETAVEAIDYASQASAAAGAAQSSASTAYAAAQTAQASADSAVADAARANEAATQAISDAATAHDAADSAQDSADKAIYALSDVEKVVGTVNWIAEHSKATSDTTVVEGKAYYERDATTGKLTYIEPESGSNPAQMGLWELDESVRNFLASHLWLDLYGLNLSVDSANGYRIHQGTVDGTKAVGTYIIDPSGNIVQTLNASGVVIGMDSGSHVSVGANSLTMADAARKLLTISFDGLVNIVNSGGDPSVTPYSEKDLYSVYAMLTSGYTVSGTAVLDPQGGATLYTVESESVRNRYGDLVCSPTRYISYDSTAERFELSARMTPQVESDAIPTVVSFGNASVRASGGKLEITADGVAEGYDTAASGLGSHAEGFTSVAEGTYSHAEGNASYATGDASHAEGDGATASGDVSHAEGTGTEASGQYSHAEGRNTHATGQSSHAQNYGTIAASVAQTALGKYNVEDENGLYAVIVGNGTAGRNRSNALTVDWSGNVECQGTVNGVDLSEVGTVETAAAASVSVPTGSNTDMRSISLGAGVWAVTGRAQFANNQTGRRAVKLSTTSQESGNVPSTLSVNPVSGGTTQVSTTRIFSLQSASTVYLVGWQNSGGALACYGEIEATRIG